MTPKTIRRALDEMAARDTDIAAALAHVGYPEPRARAPGFATLLEIIVGQQVSASAATAIRDRLHAVYDPLTPDAILAADRSILRGIGLSRRKIDYALHLADSIKSGDLNTDHFAKMADSHVVEALTRVKGIGRWSAEIYMLFALGRCDVWPAEDLAIREALRRLKQLEERPDRETSERLVEPWRPWRGVGAVFLWHYYRGAPQ